MDELLVRERPPACRDARSAFVTFSQPARPAQDWQALQNSLDCWSMVDHRYRAVTTCDGEVVVQCRLFADFLTHDGDFRMSGGKIAPRRGEDRVRFERLYATIAGDVRTELFRASRDAGHWICQAARMTGQHNSLVCLSIHHAGDCHDPQWVDFGDLLDLTDSEHQVLCGLLNGRSPKIIAAERHLSVNTVRTHVRHIYDKVDVRNVHELWHRLCEYRLS